METKFNHFQKGMGLVEILVAIGLFSIVFLGIFLAFQQGLKMVSQSRAKITAIALANQKIETARNLAYKDIGVINGIPAGTIAQEETILRNGILYAVRAVVFYIDDPFDGLSPADTLSNDYKRVKVNVSWSASFGGSVSLMTDIAPKGQEETTGGGTLSILILDASGQAVSNAQVRLVNNNVSPAIDVYYFTNSQGQIILPGSPTSTQSYQISSSKTNFNSERTYALNEQIRQNEFLANPLNPHQTVLGGELTPVSFQIDYLSNLAVKTVSEIGTPIPNIPFKIQGAKILGQDQNGKDLIKYIQNYTTESDGQILLSDLEWDTYQFFVDKTQTNLDLATTTPLQPLVLSPNSSSTIELILKAENTLLANVKNASGSEPIFGASVRLFNSPLGYEQIIPTDKEGRAFFIPLQVAQYNLEVKAQGFQDYLGAVNISGAKELSVNLEPL